MLSLSVANQQVRFRTRKNETVTVLPVTVEFQKLSRGEKKSTMVNHAEWRKVTSSDFGILRKTFVADFVNMQRKNISKEVLEKTE
ncbi:hypothetical protein CEXT_342261 [Caerostris extrusa]|uniref:Uncharacterized protein n=1 Tax=Caerostris extrusa TaxID=172846 RepID=A0AAV4VBH4_CAEEX|nr:hypothetical protein CEXT_342261 [Caerostris extrusa]